jgi:CRISPR/Cas system-associated protein Cas7 (RAMP superfamily)
MKQHVARFAPWAALMILGVFSTAKMASPAPPPEEHPHIRAAVRELREAREELRTAAHDFCGHRAEAVEKTDQALRQLQAALECDRR